MATVSGNSFGNTLDANDGVTNGNDTIFGNGGNDTIYAWGGDDVIWGGDGRDHIDGSSGKDTVVYLDSTLRVVVYLDWFPGGAGAAYVHVTPGAITNCDDYLVSIENVIGSSFDDILAGDDGDNILDGSDGNDRLDGGLLFNGYGNDTLIGGAGADELDGGMDNDTASYVTASSGVVASLLMGNGTVGDADGDTFVDIENLTGSRFDDTLTGDGLANVLDGGDGDDVLEGGRQGDVYVGRDVLRSGDLLIGGEGSDTARYGGSDTGLTVNLTSGLGFGGHAEGDVLREIENVTGSSYADDLTGDANANHLAGWSGDDTLKGGGGADTLEGDSGTDTVRYGDSSTGVEVDLLSGTGSGGTAEGDTLVGIENIVGSGHADTLMGDERNNVLSGTGGDDWLKGGGGADTLDGGEGNDTATYLNYGSGVTVSLLAGEGWDGAAEGDVLTNIENLYGTAYNDVLEGDAGANILHGDEGDDLLKGWGGADRLIGDSGVDTAAYIDSAEGVTVNLVNGTGSGGSAEGDTLSGIENVMGSRHRDILIGSAEDNELIGSDGNDALRGGAGADTLYGGAGLDIAAYIESAAGVRINLLTGTTSGGTAAGDTLIDVEHLIGSLLDDDLTGDDADNVLIGGIGLDELVGNGGDDTLDGGIGNDWLVGGAGADGFIGDSGLDTLSYDGSGAGVTVDLATGTATGGDAEGDIFAGIEHLAGSGFDDVLTGDTADNTLKGGGGDDTLVGGLGADLLMGFGDDDTYVVDNALDRVAEAGGSGTDAVITSVSYTLTAGADVEIFRTDDDNGTAAIDLTGNAAGNEITGNNAANVLDGGAGSDRLIGRGGDDTYLVDSAGDAVTENGGQGIDTVRSSVSYTLTAGADVELLATTNDNATAAINLSGNGAGNIVRGNNGSNVISGGDGNDELAGLGGQDQFRFDTALNPTSNLDEITDFNVADDTIVLENAVFSALGVGGLAAAQFAIGTAAQDVDDRLIYNSANGSLFYDSDGIGAAAPVQFAVLTPGLALTHLDFLVV